MASEAEIRDAFKAFDSDNSGSISTSEIQALLGQMGVQLTAEESQALVKAFDTDSSGKMEFSEFVKLVRAAEAQK